MFFLVEQTTPSLEKKGFVLIFLHYLKDGDLKNGSNCIKSWFLYNNYLNIEQKNHL